MSSEQRDNRREEERMRTKASVEQRREREDLHMWCVKGDLQRVKEALEQDKEMDINVLDEESMSPLHWASAYNELEILNLLLSHPNIDVNVCNKRLATPLHQAAMFGADSTLRRLTEDPRVDLHATNSWGETALMLAVQAGHLTQCKMLVKAGARIADEVDSWGSNALELATHYGEEAIAFFLRSVLETPENKNELCEIVAKPVQLTPEKRTVRVLSKLLEAPLSDSQFDDWLQEEQMDVNSADYYAMCPLHKLSAWNKDLCIQRLLAHSSFNSDQLLKPGPGGMTPLHLALSSHADRSTEALLEILRKQETVLDELEDEEGLTPLMVAVSSGNSGSVPNLLVLGSRPHHKSAKCGKSAYHLALSSQQEDLIQLLEEKIPEEVKQTIQREHKQEVERLKEEEKRRRQQRSNAGRGRGGKLDMSKFASLTRAHLNKKE